MLFCVARHCQDTKSATTCLQVHLRVSAEPDLFHSASARLPPRPVVPTMSSAGSPPAGSGSEPASSGKKRRVSARQGAQGLEPFIGFTQQGDMKYINEQLALEPRLVPFVASWLRDGTLHQAIKNTSSSRTTIGLTLASTCATQAACALVPLVRTCIA